MMLPRASFLALALFLGTLTAACAPRAPLPPTAAPTATVTPDATALLRKRPLQLLKLEAGSPCPRLHARQITPAYGIALGDGPAYVAGFTADGILDMSFPPPTDTPFYGSQWSGAKVLWFIDPAYSGPVLIRGGRLDAPGELRFDNGLNPPSQLWIEAASPVVSPDWRNLATYTRLSGPGCYMYQVDGLGFTEALIFEAQAQP
ncbi:MAG TPA: hypothetical protein VF784_08750 [Anaerolineales bacterium]